MDKPTDQHSRDNMVMESNDPDVTLRLYKTFMPDWLMPNVRLKQQHFLPKYISPINADIEYHVYFHTLNEKMEVYAFVRRLFEEHNACASMQKFRNMYMETAYLFCMDAAEGSTTSNYFMYIPKYYYRRYLEDVPILYSCKTCIIVDYHRRVAYRFGICISKMTEEIDAHSEDRSSVAETTTDRSLTIAMHRRKAAEDLILADGKQCTPADLMAMNRAIHNKKHEAHM